MDYDELVQKNIAGEISDLEFLLAPNSKLLGAAHVTPSTAGAPEAVVGLSILLYSPQQIGHGQYAVIQNVPRYVPDVSPFTYITLSSGSPSVAFSVDGFSEISSSGRPAVDLLSSSTFISVVASVA